MSDNNSRIMGALVKLVDGLMGCGMDEDEHVRQLVDLTEYSRMDDSGGVIDPLTLDEIRDVERHMFEAGPEFSDALVCVCKKRIIEACKSFTEE